MSRTGAESKPPWSAVPRAIKDEVAKLLGSPVARAERVYGGYAPSATFRMLLANGRRAFLKGVYPLTKDSGVKWDLENEERIYQECAPFMRPWAPEYFGGAWGFCPDPVDFHAFQSIDVYGDRNAYYDQGPFERFPKLLGRLPLIELSLRWRVHRIGELIKRKTLPFNGYAEQVASLYAGMDLRKFY